MFHFLCSCSYFFHIPRTFSVLLTYSLKINSLLFFTHPVYIVLVCALCRICCGEICWFIAVEWTWIIASYTTFQTAEVRQHGCREHSPSTRLLCPHCSCLRAMRVDSPWTLNTGVIWLWNHSRLPVSHRVVHGLGWPIGWVGLTHWLGWADPWVGLGWDFSVYGGLGWVHCSKSTKNERIMLMHLKHG